MTRYRDWDGTIRLIERRGATKGAATKALTLAIRDRSRASSGSDITPDTKVAVLAEQWLTEVSSGSLSPSTLEVYGDMLRRLIIPALGNLRVRELTVGSVDRHLNAVKVKHGPAVAKTDRTVLSGLCKLACRHDALGSNPCRETSRLSTKPKKPPTSLSVDEIRLLHTSLAEDQQAIEAGIVDLVTLLMASGLRLGEALSLRWADVELESGTLEVKGRFSASGERDSLLRPHRSRRLATGSSSCRRGPQICFAAVTRRVSVIKCFLHLGQAPFGIEATQAGPCGQRSLVRALQGSAVTHSERAWPL
jgi:integrase